MDQGQDLCTDNWYTSLPLANSLLDRRKNVIETIRKKQERFSLGIDNQETEERYRVLPVKQQGFGC